MLVLSSLLSFFEIKMIDLKIIYNDAELVCPDKKILRTLKFKNVCAVYFCLSTDKIRKKDIPQLEAIKNVLQKEIDFFNKFIDNLTD